MKRRQEQVNTKHILGVILIAFSLFSTIGALGWVLGYWDNSLQETYRGHDIYYFPQPNVYGVDIGGDSSDWPFNAGLQGCRNLIDSWLDEPDHIETYRDFEIYQIQGFRLYYAINGKETTAKWVLLESLKEYIDTEYYPTRVRIIKGEKETWIIYRQGTYPIIYWAETEGFKSPVFSSLATAKEYVNTKLETAEPEETSDNPENPEVRDPIPGNLKGERETIRDRLDAQRGMISAISGVFGLGFIALGEAERRDED